MADSLGAQPPDAERRPDAAGCPRHRLDRPTQAERTHAEAELRAIAGTTPRWMTRAEITALVTALGDITTVLRDADPADKAEVDRQLGLRLNYRPETQTVHAEADLSAHRGLMGRVRGATPPIAHRR